MFSATIKADAISSLDSVARMDGDNRTVRMANLSIARNELTKYFTLNTWEYQPSWGNGNEGMRCC